MSGNTMRVEGGSNAAPIEYTDQIKVEDLALAERTESLSFLRDLSESDRASLNETISGLVSSDQVTEAEAKGYADHFRKKRKEIKDELKRYGAAVRTGKLEVTEEVYVYVDRVNGKVHVYDHNGNRILQRRMNADEAQLQIP